MYNIYIQPGLLYVSFRSVSHQFHTSCLSRSWVVHPYKIHVFMHKCILACNPCLHLKYVDVGFNCIHHSILQFHRRFILQFHTPVSYFSFILQFHRRSKKKQFQTMRKKVHPYILEMFKNAAAYHGDVT